MTALRSVSEAKTPPPFSIRFTDAERVYLKREAGDLSLAAHIRRQLFPEDMCLQKRNATKRVRQPSVDHQALASVLARLGQSRLSQNLNQIAKAANMGALPVTPDLVDELIEACAEIRQLRADVMAALGMKTGDAP
ncbi:MAG: plasmid mobilization relaxosome protein MobC [Alphaproteobacteria bacterium]|nr:plasmid mobilization relaxosome protein MobC [Alphaproteobacteria bacterium]